MSTLGNTWQAIEASIQSEGGPGPAGIRFAEAGVDFPFGPARAGIDPEGRRHVIIPVGDDGPGLKDDASRGIRLEVTVLKTEKGDDERVLEIYCPVPDLHELFTVIAEEMLDAAAARPDNIPAACVHVLDRWRELLARESSGVMSRSEAGAILAELHVLEQLCSIKVPSLDQWLGPDKGRHDFVSASADLEVKSTLSRESFSVVIHGLQQLEERDGVPVFLWFVRYEFSPGGTDSIPDAVDRLAAAGVSLSPLLKKLSLVNYHPRDRIVYEQMRFSLQEQFVYAVTPSFPRLTRGAFKKGHPAAAISTVDYVVDLIHQSCVPLEAAGVTSLLNQFASGGSSDA